MITEHAAPVLAALRGIANPALTVSDGPADPQNPPDLPYVVPYISIDVPDAVSFEEAYDKVTCTIAVHSVAGNSDAVRRVADRVLAALLGLRPVIPGRDCSRIRRVDGQPPDWDRSTGRLLVWQVDVFEYETLPG
ncbi:hypothetical protein [Actinoplanes siamensis]|uniref:DUF3168 domain-containing protein n=1 Tax=Actinoplanes siamensis TaxID=1223317 RepID=A0A919NCG5_9ACTN|nr:hypothetical protein [Actinoplanes siamensis]GIF08659.1 hypothetical protein Asi03nite_61970 [Actinoplanes siamensis]